MAGSVDMAGGGGALRRALGRPALLAAALTTAIQVPLHLGWLVDPAGLTLANPFHGVHGWAGDVVGEALWSGRWPDPTTAAGFPIPHRARFVAWPVLVVAAALRPLLSAMVVVNLSAWLGPALGAAAMVRLARQLDPRVTPAGLIAGGVLFGLSPVTLGAAASGQIENAQTWVLPLLLLSVGWAAARPRLLRLGAVAVVWGIGGMTSPYLSMIAAFAAPWVGWRAGWRPAIGPLAAAAVALVGIRWWLDPGGWDPELDLFKPSYGHEGWPPLWSNPLAVADVDTLLLGLTAPQAKAMVLHQPYLGLVFAAAALGLSRSRRMWTFPVVVGVLLALGPVLGWREGPLVVASHEVWLPAMLARWVDFPLAHGGQYYRCVVLAHLGLAGMLASAARPGWSTLGLTLGAGDALRCVAMVGLPWHTATLPVDTWSGWAEEDAPGAVLHLPQFSPFLVPCHPIRLAGRTVHGRDLSDLPRAHQAPPAVPVLETLYACTRRGRACTIPGREELGELGFRYAVLDLPDVPERHMLGRRLTAAWGPPDGVGEGMSWWLLTGASSGGDGQE